MPPDHAPYLPPMFPLVRRGASTSPGPRLMRRSLSPLRTALRATRCDSLLKIPPTPLRATRYRFTCVKCGGDRRHLRRRYAPATSRISNRKRSISPIGRAIPSAPLSETVSPVGLMALLSPRTQSSPLRYAFCDMPFPPVSNIVLCAFFLVVFGHVV